LRIIALLVPRVAGIGTYGAIDAFGLREPYVERQKNDSTDAEAICEEISDTDRGGAHVVDEAARDREGSSMGLRGHGLHMGALTDNCEIPARRARCPAIGATNS
jgi:hypothetical protein